MILAELLSLAEREELVDPGFQIRDVAFLVQLDGRGRFKGLLDLREERPSGKGRTRKSSKPMRVPAQPGRSGTKAPAFLLVDNAKYVFGRVIGSSAGWRSGARQAADSFRQRVEECAAATGDAGVSAVLQFLKLVAAGEFTEELPENCASNDQFAFALLNDRDLPVHERPAVVTFVRSRSLGAAGAPGGEGGQCLVTGQSASAAGLFPLIENVPGGTPARLGLVSFNNSAFASHGWDANENAVISFDASLKCATALNRLLDPSPPKPGHADQHLPRRNVRVSDDTVVCYWAEGRAGDALADSVFEMFDPIDPGQVSDLVHSIWRGREVRVGAAGAFYVLVLSGSVGRVIVRDWMVTGVQELLDHLHAYFEDLRVVAIRSPTAGSVLRDAMPLRTLVNSLSGMGQNDKAPPGLAARLIRAAMAGGPFPLAILQRAVERTRAEIPSLNDKDKGWRARERHDARVALIKAVLRRNTSHRELRAHMDPMNHEPGYLLGRLMAVLERLQQAALGDVNAGIVDRYFAAASASPRVVFVRLLKNARHHARKALDDPAKAGLARWLERTTDEIAAPFDPGHNGFPAYLSLEQQGLFVLGYHQQRHALWQPRREGDADDASSST